MLLLVVNSYWFLPENTINSEKCYSSEADNDVCAFSQYSLPKACFYFIKSMSVYDVPPHLLGKKLKKGPQSEYKSSHIQSIYFALIDSREGASNQILRGPDG